MAYFLFGQVARPLAKNGLVLLFIVAVCSASVHPLEIHPSPAADQARVTPDALSPPPVAEPDEPAAGPGTVLPPTATATSEATGSPVAALPSVVTATPLPYPAKDTLGRWWGQLAAVRAGAPGAQATIALVGDSWVDGDVVLGRPLREALQVKYGDGGSGYVEFGGGGNAKGPPFGQNITYERTGSWTVHDAFTDPPGRGVDLADVSSADTSTPGAIALSGPFDVAILHYVEQPGGGSFRWRIDSGPWREVTTAAPRLALATERIEGLASGRHILNIEVSSAGAAGVRLAGADLRKLGAGVRVDRVGMNGATALDYSRADAGVWQAGLAALEPDLVILLLGTNDDARQRPPSQYREDMNTIVDRVRAAVPLAGILLLAPGDNNLKATGRAPLGMDEYNAQLQALAAARGLAFLDSSQVLGLFPEANARGLYYDDIHINEAGGKLLIGYLLENLVDLPVQSTDSTHLADWPLPFAR